MKNIHVLPTDKLSRIHVDLRSTFLTPNYQIGKEINSVVDSINIYITSDEEIKEGDWCFYVNSIYKVLRINSNNRPIIKMYDGTFEISYYKKIILTTDQDLIKDGVQAIDDEFLEWFINNPSCEVVEVERMFNVVQFTSREFIYKIIIPKEEAKEETLEEAFGNWADQQSEKGVGYDKIDVLQFGFKWQQEKMYSEEDLKEIIYLTWLKCLDSNGGDFIDNRNEILEQFKNK